MLLTGSLKIASVFDSYDYENSIKLMERERHTSGEAGPKYAIQGECQVPNYRKFLRNSTNKAVLAEFLCNYLTEKGPSVLKDGQSIALAGGFNDGQIVKCVDCTGSTDCLPLFSAQEETDIRIMLHAVSLSETFCQIMYNVMTQMYLCSYLLLQ